MGFWVVEGINGLESYVLRHHTGKNPSNPSTDQKQSNINGRDLKGTAKETFSEAMFLKLIFYQKLLK